MYIVYFVLVQQFLCRQNVRQKMASTFYTISSIFDRSSSRDLERRKDSQRLDDFLVNHDFRSTLIFLFTLTNLTNSFHFTVIAIIATS